MQLRLAAKFGVGILALGVHLLLPIMAEATPCNGLNLSGLWRRVSQSGSTYAITQNGCRGLAVSIDGQTAGDPNRMSGSIPPSALSDFTNWLRLPQIVSGTYTLSMSTQEPDNQPSTSIPASFTLFRADRLAFVGQVAMSLHSRVILPSALGFAVNVPAGDSTALDRYSCAEGRVGVVPTLTVNATILHTSRAGQVVATAGDGAEHYVGRAYSESFVRVSQANEGNRGIYSIEGFRCVSQDEARRLQPQTPAAEPGEPARTGESQHQSDVAKRHEKAPKRSPASKK